MTTATVMTVEQFAQMHMADTEDFELLEGELIPLSSGTPLHAKVRDRVGDLLRRYFAQNPTGEVFAEVDCRLSGQTVRRPDLSIFIAPRARNFDLNIIPIPFAPDIAIEVLSPSEGYIDVNRKTSDYLAAGCSEVWLLDNPNNEIFVHTSTTITLRRGKDLLETPLLPGFSHPVTDLLV